MLELNGRDVRTLPLRYRRQMLASLIRRTGSDVLRLSEPFEYPGALLAELERLGIEGIVSKRIDQPYRSSTACGWIKVKTASWREANRDRWRKFQR